MVLKSPNFRKFAVIYENSNVHYIVANRRVMSASTIFYDLGSLRKSSEDVQPIFGTLKSIENSSFL